MKHLKTSLIVLADVLAAIGIVTLFVPSVTQGYKSEVPRSAFSVTGTSGEGTVVFTLTGPDPEGTSYAITSLTVANGSGIDSGGVVLAFWGDTNSNCSFQAGSLRTFGPTVRVPAGETVHLEFPQPFVFSARPGATSCVIVNAYNLGVSFTAVGYKF